MKRMFSGFRSVCVSLFLCRTGRKKEHVPLKSSIDRQATYFAAKKKRRCHLLTAHCSDNLVCHVPDVFHRKRLEIVFLEEIVGAEAKKLKGNTNMAAKVKPVQHMHTRAAQKKCNCKYAKFHDDFKGEPTRVTFHLLTIFFQYRTT